MMIRTTIWTNWILIMLLWAGTVRAYGQDLHFSQFYETPLLRNPALAGIFTGDYRIQMTARSQWYAFDDGYRTGSLHAEYKMPVGKGDDYITGGLQFLYDLSGAVRFSTTQVLPALNYHKSLRADKPMYLSFGVMGGLIRKSIDVSRITTDAQYQDHYDGSLPIGENNLFPSFSTWDASAGISFNSSFGNHVRNMIFLGASYQHLNRPSQSFYRQASVGLHPKYVFSAGVRLGVDEYSYFTLQADQWNQGPASETIGGALYSYALGDNPDQAEYVVSAGAFLRWKDAVIPVIRLEKNSFSLGLSYDVNTSPLKTGSQIRGGFELSLSYIGFTKKMSSTQQKVVCPRF